MVSTFYVQVWLNAPDQGLRRILVEDDDVVHAGKRLQKLDPILFGCYRSAWSLGSTRRGVGVHPNDEQVSEFVSFLQKKEVTPMQQVEAPVSKDYLPP